MRKKYPRYFVHPGIESFYVQIDYPGGKQINVEFDRRAADNYDEDDMEDWLTNRPTLAWKEVRKEEIPLIFGWI